MPDATITGNAIFPVGTSVGAYGADAGLSGDGKPLGALVQSQTMGIGSVTFTSLAVGRYYAAAQVGGVWRHVAFVVESPPPATVADEAAARAAADALLIPRSIGAAKADLVGFTASGMPVRLPGGSDGQVLTVDSAQAAGIKWAPPSGVGGLEGIVNPEDYGAVGDDTHDDTAAFQAALDAIRDYNAGGTLWLPPGKVWKITSTLQVDDQFDARPAIRICGAGGWAQLGHYSTQIHYTGSAGPLFAATHAKGLEIDHLSIRHSAADPSAVHLVDFDGSGGPDAQMFHMHHCATEGTTAGVMSASAVRLKNAIIGSIDHCHITAATHGVLVDGPLYGVALDVDKTTFNFQGTGTDHAFIGVKSGDCEALSVTRCAFEDPGSGGAAIRGMGATFYSLAIEKNWCGDCTGDSDWFTGLTMLGNNAPAIVSGNTLNPCGSGIHIRGSGNFLVLANHIYGSTAFGGLGSVSHLNAQSNFFHSSTIFDTGAYPRDLTSFSNGTDTPADPTKTLPDSITHEEGSFFGMKVGEYMDFEVPGSTPGEPGANRVRQFVRTNGGGKQELCAKFHGGGSGPVVIIATEP